MRRLGMTPILFIRVASVTYFSVQGRIFVRNDDHFREQLQKEIEERIDLMEDPSYDFGPSFNKQDMIGIYVVAGICLIGLVWGVL